MVYIRGNAFDYDQWAELGATGWSYADVLPYFRRSEGNERGGDDFHGSDGPLNVMDQRWPNVTTRRFVESAASLQLPRTPDFTGAHQEGLGLYQVTQNAAESWVAARAYVEPLHGRATLDHRTGALSHKIFTAAGPPNGAGHP